MSDKANNYHKRKRFQRNKNRNDPDDSSRATSNYQRLISNNSNKTDSNNNYTSQNTPIILKYANGGETNLLTWQPGEDRYNFVRPLWKFREILQWGSIQTIVAKSTRFRHCH